MHGKEDMSGLWIVSPVLLAAGAGMILLIWSFAEHLRSEGSAGPGKEPHPGWCMA